jgi:hypothetical protein
MRTHLVCLVVLLSGLALSSSGCLALVVGAGAAGTVAYMAGDMEAEENYSIDQVYTAAKKATEDLKLHLITGEGGKDAMSATLVARDAADKRITIKLTSTTVNTTKISIRVGTFGSETKSRLVYSKMMENLRAAAPAAQTAATAQPAQTPPAPPAAQEPAQSPASPPPSQQPAPTPPAPATPPAQGTPTPGQ